MNQCRRSMFLNEGVYGFIIVLLSSLPLWDFSSINSVSFVVRLRVCCIDKPHSIPSHSTLVAEYFFRRRVKFPIVLVAMLVSVCHRPSWALSCIESGRGG